MNVGPRIPDDEAEKVGNTLTITSIATSLSMDPNAEERPATAHIAEVDVDIKTEVRRMRVGGAGLMKKARAVPVSNPPLEPFMASSIFRRAFDDGSSQRQNVSRPAGLSTQAREFLIIDVGRKTDE